MKIKTFAHPGLRRLYLANKPTGVPPAVVGKLRRILAFLQDMGDINELRTLPTWRAHQLGGDRKGTWSLHVTANWRLTFRIEHDELIEVNFEDYH